MRKNKYKDLHTRVSAEIAQAIDDMATPSCPPYKVLQNIIVSYIQAAKYPPISDSTLSLACQVAKFAGYDNADALIEDLCRSFERTIRANRGELHNGEDEVDNDILEMFRSVIDEKETVIRKRI